MLAHICDKCKKVLTKGEAYEVGISNIHDGEYLSDRVELDFCEDCWNEVKDFYLGKFGEPTGEDIDEDEEEPTGETTGESTPTPTEPINTPTEPIDHGIDGKRGVEDVGKILALKKAGWTTKAISEDMGLSVSRVNYLYYKSIGVK